VSEDYSHLHPSVRSLAGLDGEARIASIRSKRWIEHSSAGAILHVLQETLEQPTSERMENVLLIAESGMGKTSLLRRFERRNAIPFDETAGIKRQPVVVMLMPPEPTETEFFLRLLTTLGTPEAALRARAGPRLRELASRLLHEGGTRVLVIDEINSLLVGTARQQRMFLQLLRFMSNDLGIALICAGVPEARHALRSDAQLRSRFCDLFLPSWTADAALQDFVNRVVQSLPLRLPSPVVSPAVCKLLAQRSGGITALICRALERAAIAAVRSHRERIDLAALQDDAIWRDLTLRHGSPRTLPATLVDAPA
jgi:type II secretory pathway predicted ATPase ExeA